MTRTALCLLALAACDSRASREVDKFLFGIPTHEEMQSAIDDTEALIARARGGGVDDHPWPDHDLSKP